MNLCNGFTKVSIATTTSTAATQIKALATGQVPYLNALHVTMASSGTLTIATATAVGSTTITILAAPLLRKATPLDWEFQPTVEGALAGTRARNLQIQSTGANINGYAVVSWSTI